MVSRNEREKKKRKRERLSNLQPTLKKTPKPVLQADPPIIQEPEQPATLVPVNNSLWRNISKRDVFTVIGILATILGLWGAFFTGSLQLGGFDMALAHWLMFISWLSVVLGVGAFLFFWERLSSTSVFKRIILLIVVTVISGFVNLHWDNKMVKNKAEIDEKAEQARLALEQQKISAERPSPAFLVHDRDPNPPNKCKIPPDAIAVYFGDSVAWSTKSTINLIIINDEPVLSVEKTFNGLLINAILRDNKGNEVARITKNVFIPKSNDEFKPQSPDPHSIQVFNKKNQVVLYVKYLNQQSVKFFGIFQNPNGTPFVIDEGQSINSHNYNRNCFGEVTKAVLVY